ncbi:VOC family protein [Sulfitobacter mediterraneus]|uniref:VOC family protein n=1 Tax=Sulfitobacter mediterraneus TaxID=83219 RepID=UPI001933896C|nr:VOC family protein [Sulfitobacter mediterraneus]MBM1309326.1 VOC family protein [Sulfitobacter mediterraneus]MBM1313211.1 VOC family protein [Sulfitobacter mediterraneus]MBM1321595.1 VOC family protein [Sulfitobacter mediterraneus]MBM1325482.1 VOC family protein [Sulfitobacter mediterraneus]MBM1396828.1 VOC family protein [Sulfitobacter mediterraneus]
MRLTQITPFVPCTTLAAQIGFYRDTLGFTLGFEADNYAFLRRDGVAVRLVEVCADIDLKDPAREGSFYIDVQGIDALYADLKPMLDRLPAGRVRAPFNQDYGQREFHVADEDCTLVFFGEGINSDG